MCPLRLILIFLSATLAGFFVLRSLKAQPELGEATGDDSSSGVAAEDHQLPFCTKMRTAIGTGFWTCVDMASGRYLWRNLVGKEEKSS